MSDYKKISHNFTVAKVLSIVMVLTGHFFGGLLWVPTTIALFIFAFSSGYFTSSRYSTNYSIRKFWKNKVDRLVGRLIIINLFLLILFIFRNKEGIFIWHTIVSMLGMNGLMEWFGIANKSPFGSGLWFFTLLIIFYLVYPLIQRVLNTKNSFGIMLFIILILSAMHYLIPMEYSLWMTAISFIFGVFVCSKDIKIRNYILYASLTLLIVSIFIFNFMLQIKDSNYIFILGCAINVVLLLLTIKIPRFIYVIMLPLSGCVLEIYFIHTYLFIRKEDLSMLTNYFLSLFTIILVSLFLSFLARKLNFLFKGTFFVREL